MKWYHYFACLFAGAFLANSIPHFIQGVSGNPFPSPFSDPPGKGLSSPTLNVMWGLGNFVVGYTLWRAGKLSQANKIGLALCFGGFVCMSIALSATFVNRVR